MSTPHIAEESAQERRGSQRLFSYWNRLRGGRPFPLEEEMDPTEIADLWESCFLIQKRDVEHVPYYNYTYIGEKIVRAYESGELPGFVPGLVATDAAHLSVEYQMVFKSGEPVQHERQHLLDDTTEVIYRQCLVPLGNHEGVLASILGHMSYRICGRS